MIPSPVQSFPRMPVRVPDDLTFRIFIESVRDYALLVLDTAGMVISWNAGAEAIKGYRAEEIIGRHFSVFYPPEYIERGLPAHELEVAAREGHFEDEGWRVRKDGSRFWADVVFTPLRASDGALIGYAKVTRDLTERRAHEERLRLNETRFRSLVEGVSDYAIMMLDLHGEVASWNAGARQIYGFEAGEMIGTHYSRLVPAETDTREHTARELTAARREGRFRSETWRLRKDGSRFWAHVLITAIRDCAGKVSGFSFITRDLTERRRHEAALRQSEERFRLLVENVVDYAIGTLDADGKVTSWNHGAERITGYTAEEIVGQSFSRLYPPEDIRANKPGRQLASARSRGRVNEESWRMRRDGSQYWANTVLATLPPGEGQQSGFYLVTQDLTQRRYAENLADTTQRLHEFIAMLAHELRNPLAPIRNAVAIMARREVADPLMDAMRVTIDRQSQNLTRIVNELLDVNRVARGQLTIDKHPVDLRDVLARAVEMSRPLIEARGHKLHIDIADHPIECLADPMRLSQVMVNILDNAARYTPDGGNIWLSVERQAHMVELRIRDDGRGIERDNLDRVFDLFSQVDPSVDATFGGLGVGLALARRIVELHGGYVQAMSEGPGKGSEFVLRLPIGTRARLPEPVVPITPGSAEFLPMRILVVDDNVDAADSLCLLMRAMGHETRSVYDGPAAIVAAEEMNPEVVMLDIGMPIMNGYQVARALRNARSTATIVAVTGWGHEAAKRQTREAGFDQHLVKPVTESALIELLAQLAAQRLAKQSRKD